MNIDIDINRVRAAIRETPLVEHVYDEVAANVARAIKTFVKRDAEMYAACEIEEEWIGPAIAGCEHAHGYFDKRFTRPDGRCVIVDWKTTDDMTRGGWLEKLRHSTQTKFYLGFGRPYLERVTGVSQDLLYLEYRCFDTEGRVKTIQVPWTYQQQADAEAQLLQVQTTVENLSTGSRWPQRMPWACFESAKTAAPTCPFWNVCVAPHKFVEIDISTYKYPAPPRSKSSVDDFLWCPEYYRQTRVLGETAGDDIVTRGGTAFHAAMNEVYRQVWKNPA